MENERPVMELRASLPAIVKLNFAEVEISPNPAKQETAAPSAITSDSDDDVANYEYGCVAFAASTGRVAAVSGANKGVGFFIGE